MSEQSGGTNRSDDTEVELTAVDLVKLEEKSDPGLTSQAAPRRRTAWRWALPAGLLVAAVAAGGTLLIRTQEPPVTKPAPAAAPTPMPDWVTQEIAEPVPEPAPEPVRFTNPFDKSEVFEFPAGTTREEAQAAVATLLLERGTERRASDPKLRKKHKKPSAAGG